MTIDWRTLVVASAAALTTWFAGVVIAAYVLEPSTEVIAWVPGGRLGKALAAAPVSVLGSSGGFVQLRGESPGFVRTLYSGGAWVVLPGLRGGCRVDALPKRLSEG